MEIITLPTGEDNYMYVLVADHAVAVIDPLDASRVELELEQRGLRLQSILVTHHHYDHIAGVAELKRRTGARVIAGEDQRIPMVDRVLSDGGVVELGAIQVKVLGTPGHGDCDISYLAHEPGFNDALFCGDTLFVSGCGRILEGSAESLWNSLEKFKSLSDDTQVFCGHEYTEENLLFACSIAPEMSEYRERLKQIQGLCRQGVPTVPSTIGMEKLYNPFLRAVAFEDFVRLRQQKDRF